MSRKIREVVAIVRQLGRYLNGGRWTFGKKIGGQTQTEDPSLHTQCRPISGEACRGLRGGKPKTKPGPPPQNRLVFLSRVQLPLLSSCHGGRASPQELEAEGGVPQLGQGQAGCLSNNVSSKSWTSQ